MQRKTVNGKYTTRDVIIMEPNADKSTTDAMPVEICRKERQEMRNGQSGILVASICVDLWVGGCHRRGATVAVEGNVRSLKVRWQLAVAVQCAPAYGYTSCIPRNPCGLSYNPLWVCVFPPSYLQWFSHPHSATSLLPRRFLAQSTRLSATAWGPHTSINV